MSMPLTQEQIADALKDLSGWRYEGDRLRKTFGFRSFPEAISFIVRLAFYAETENHHPELHNVYDKVEVALCTHAAGNKVTQRDVDLAGAIQGFSWV